MNAGVQGPSFKSNVSIWLGAPVSRMKTTFLAVPMGVAAARAMFSPRRPGRKKYPLTAVARWRKNMRRPRRGIFITLVTELELQFVDQSPSEVFERGIFLRRS